MQPCVEIKVLGSLEIRSSGGDLIPIGGERQRRLLAALAARPDVVVEKDRLVDLVWEGDPPAGARQTLRTYVHRLRRSIESAAEDIDGGEVIATHSPGYVLVTGRAQLDAMRAERWISESRRLRVDDPVAAAAKLEDALALWRGEPFGEFANEEWAQGAAARLKELRAVIAEELLQLRLDLGEHREALPAIRGYVAEFPLRERGWMLLMLALYRSDRQPDALRAYQDYLTILAEETGLEPSTDASELERRIVTRDAALGIDAVPQAVSPPSSALRNFPVPATRFVGRRDEVHELVRLIDEHRLVTLTGPGGVGKTRLALQAAAEGATHFDVVAFADLAGVEEPDEVPDKVLGALGLNRGGAVDATDALGAHLHARSTLLVIDNFEHVIEAARFVRSLLETAPGLHLMVTSHEPLHLAGEQNYPVSPLSVPDVGAEMSLAAVAGFEAVELFADRAAAANPRFALDDESFHDVADICAGLEGLPLAIELAAARVRAFPPSMLRQRLEHDLIGLGSGPIDAPERHQSLERLVRWSYDLLEDDEKTVLTRLSVFKGGATLEAAGEVCSHALCVDVVDVLEALVDKSILSTVPGRTGQVRFQMLDAIRAFAAERLADAGNGGTIRRLHAQHFAGLAERAAIGLRGPEQVWWNRSLTDDYGNLTAALASSFDDGDPTDGLRIVAALRHFWHYGGRHRDMARWVGRALAVPEASDHRLQAGVMITAGTLWQGGGADSRTPSPDLHRAAELFKAAGDASGESLAVILAGVTDWTTFREKSPASSGLDCARAEVRRGVELARAADAHEIVAKGLRILGEFERLEENHQSAMALQEESLGISRRIGDVTGQLVTSYNLGCTKRHLGQVDEAFGLHRHVLEASVDAGIDILVPLCLVALAEQAAIRHRPEVGARLIGAADSVLDLWGAVPAPQDATENRRIRADVRDRLGDEIYGTEVEIGRGLSIDEAVTLVRATLRLPTESHEAGSEAVTPFSRSG